MLHVKAVAGIRFSNLYMLSNFLSMQDYRQVIENLQVRIRLLCFIALFEQQCDVCRISAGYNTKKFEV